MITREPYDVRVMRRYAAMAGWQATNLPARDLAAPNRILFTRGDWQLVVTLDPIDLGDDDYRNATWPTFNAHNLRTHEFARTPEHSFGSVREILGFMSEVVR